MRIQTKIRGLNTNSKPVGSNETVACREHDHYDVSDASLSLQAFHVCFHT